MNATPGGLGQTELFNISWEAEHNHDRCPKLPFNID